MITLLMKAADGFADSTSARLRSANSSRIAGVIAMPFSAKYESAPSRCRAVRSSVRCR